MPGQVVPADGDAAPQAARTAALVTALLYTGARVWETRAARPPRRPPRRR